MSNARYSILPARAVFDTRLSLYDKVVLAALGSYTDGDGWCFPHQKTLAERLGIARSTICASIKKLSSKEVGYLEVRARTASGRGKIGNEYRVKTDLPPMSVLADIGGRSPMSVGTDTGSQGVESTPMSASADIGPVVRRDGHPMSAGTDFGNIEGTTPSERPQSSPASNEAEEDIRRKAAYEAAARAKAEAEAKAKEAKKPKAKKALKPVAYTPEFQMIWMAWPKHRRANSDKRKAFERYQAGVEQFGAEAVSAAAQRYLSLPETRKDQWRYCCLVEVFMNGKLEAAVEAALEAPAEIETATHEDAEHRAAKRYHAKTGRWPQGYHPPMDVRQ